MKSIFYVGGVVRIYRAALDYLAALPAEAWRDPAAIVLPPIFKAEIAKTGTRGATENFIDQRPGGSEMIYHTSREQQSVLPVAVIKEAGESPLVEVRNVLKTGDMIEYMGTGIEVTAVTVAAMRTEKGEEISRANPGNRVFLSTEPTLAGGEVNGMLRRQEIEG